MTSHQLWKQPEDDEISLGYKTLTAIKSISYTAEDKYRGCGKGGVAKSVVEGMTDCGGMALIFCACMRANSIPARLMQGQLCDLKPVINLNPDIKKHEFSLGLHAMAEFYATGVGWIPVETTDKALLTFGKDRRSNPFLTRHFDFCYDLPVVIGEKEKILHPIFIPSFFPLMLQTKSSVKGFLFERQEWNPRVFSFQ